MKTKICIAVIIVSVCFLALYEMNHNEPKAYTEYTVEYGDTLYEIAKEYSDGCGKVDMSIIIRDMKEESGCTANIYPGQTVKVPQYYATNQ